jgi:GT2 family glycosyltransferase
VPRVSVAILHHRGPELLDVVLGSLERQRYRDFETIVVDDASDDGSAEHLRERWPQVRVVRTGERAVGVAAALNRAVAAATGELVALLNNDVELDPEWLAQLTRALDRQPQAGSAAGKLRNYWRRNHLDGTGDVFLRAGAGGKRGHGELDTGQYDREGPVLAPTGGAGLYRRDALAAVGPFDESFGAYFEDVDWGLRAQRAGYRSWYVPEAVAYHMEGRTTGGPGNPRYCALQWRNTVAVLAKNAPAGWIASRLPWIAAHHLAGLVRSARAGLLRAHLAGLGAALRALPAYRREHARLRRAHPLSASGFERRVAAGR